MFLESIKFYDKTHHESEVCDFRRVKCHDCAEMKKELAEIKLQLGMMKEIKDLDERRNESKCEVRDNSVSCSNSRENIIGAEEYANKSESVEMFSWEKKARIPLPYTNYCCCGTSLVTYKNEIIAVGGGLSDKMKKINLEIY